MSEAIESRQPAIEVPLRPGLILRDTGYDLAVLRCDLPLWLEMDSGRLSEAIAFRVDSGCEITSVGVDAARAVGMPVPADGSPEFDLTSVTAAGKGNVRVRPGWIRAWWSRGREGAAFDWPVLYFVAPINRRYQKPLLGLGGVITTCSWTIVGPQPSDPSGGYITFNDVRTVQVGPM